MQLKKIWYTCKNRLLLVFYWVLNSEGRTRSQGALAPNNIDRNNFDEEGGGIWLAGSPKANQSKIQDISIAFENKTNFSIKLFNSCINIFSLEITIEEMFVLTQTSFSQKKKLLSPKWESNP